MDQEKRFAEKLFVLYNGNGMAIKSSYCVWNKQSRYIAFDALGAETAVKAVFATVNNGRGIGSMTLKLSNYRQERLAKLLNTNYVTDKKALLQDPTYHRWHFRAEIPKDAAYTYIYGVGGYDVVREQFYRAMQRSIYPIQRDWVDALFQRGLHTRAITSLKYTPNMSFGFEIDLNPWSEIIDQMIKHGDIHVADLREAA